jgi:hypothetical protein
MIRQIAELLLTAGLAAASPITYTVSVNTAAISGTTGFLDFDLAPGNDSQSAFATISNFSTTGTLSGGPQVNGAVTGTLPGTLTIGNSTQFNDYFQGFTYGTSIAFKLAFSGPALSSPDKTSTSGSTFAFAMFDSTGANPLLTSDPNGNTFLVGVNLDGSTTVTNFLTASGGMPPATIVAAVPEPSTLALAVLDALVLTLAAIRGLPSRTI